LLVPERSTSGLGATRKDTQANVFQQLQVNSNWLRLEALPLWANNGFDSAHDMFEERLTFAGEPMAAPRRVMVQARQSATYAAAALSGRFADGASIANKAGRTMVQRYFEADGSAGWVFSLDRDGNVADAKRDLYAHAFVLFALAWLLRLECDTVFTSAVNKTLKFIDSHFTDPIRGGCWDCLPRLDSLRRQNPHMHLFESLIALFETTRSEEILVRCKALRELAARYFIDPESGAVREYYDDNWTVSPASGEGSVEPGHLYEWAWLLRRYEKISGEDQSEVVASMLDLALRTGTDRARGRIIDEIDETGNVRAQSSRSWPHAEALKALSTEVSLSGFRDFDLLARILRRIGEVYCAGSLHGGWVDHVDTQDHPISQFMPASSLYHIYFGITSIEDLLQPV
jgi:mannose/cellobiose epimerase-like protein (N-acyl-D-glucosamine 2-epimerase family)